MTQGSDPHGTLTELLNICGNQALHELAHLLGGAVLTPEVPRSIDTDTLESKTWGKDGAAMLLPVEGLGTNVCLMFFFEHMGADWIADALTSLAGIAPTDSMRTSALLEVGNIVSCRFLDTASALAHCRLLPEPPQLWRGSLRDMVTPFFKTEALGAAMRFSARSSRVQGWVVLVMAPDAFEVLRAGWVF